MNNLNVSYTEISLGHLTDDMISHLAIQMELSGESPCKIIISPSEVSYTAFDLDEMNRVRKALLLLIVAVSNYEDDILLEKGIVTLPEDGFVSGINRENGGDLFNEFPLTAKSFCLYRAYQLLTEKLSERNTPLFRILYICTCLEFWRQRIPPEVVAGPIGKDVHWGDLILKLTNNFSIKSQEKFKCCGFGGFINLLKNEIEKVSVSEIPEIILRHFYAKNGIQVEERVGLVKSYLQTIMSQSRTMKSTQLPPSA